MFESMLDFYAKLLVQSDGLVEGSEKIGTNTNGADAVYSDVSERASALIRHFEKEANCQLERSDLAGEWLRKWRSVPAASSEALEDSADDGDCVMKSLLTAADTFDWRESLRWYVRIQRMTDMIVLERCTECQNCLDGVRLEDLTLLEHVTIIALEASLQGLELLDLFDLNEVHAAGDVLILIILALRKIPGRQQDELIGVEERVSESARVRLYELMAKLCEEGSATKATLLEKISGMENAVRLEKPLMDSSGDIKRGIELVLKLFRDDVSDYIFEALTFIVAEQANAPNLMFTKSPEWHAMKLTAAIDRAVDGGNDLNWSMRLEMFVEANETASLEIKDVGYVIGGDSIALGLLSLMKWLIKELQISESWVNNYRDMCRASATKLLYRLVRVAMISPEPLLRKEHDDLVSELITLIARSWAQKNTKPACSPSCSSPSAALDSKEVDRLALEECDALVLLSSIAEILPEDTSNAGVKLMDDVLDQIICAVMRGSTFGLPLFLENAVGSVSRAGLCEQRKGAQNYYATVSSTSEDNLTLYREVYRPIRNDLKTSATVQEMMMRSALRISAWDTYCCKLLSYANNEQSCDSVVTVCADELLRLVRAFRRDLLAISLGPEKGSLGSGLWTTSTRTMGRERPPELMRMRNVKMKPSIKVTERMYEFLWELKRYSLEVSRVDAEVSRVDVEGLESLKEACASVIGDVWLPRCIESLQCLDELEDSVLNLSCRLCLICDYLEEDDTNVEIKQQGEENGERCGPGADEGEDVEQHDAASELSSLADFIDFHFKDDCATSLDAAVSSSGRGFNNSQLRPELYSFIQNTFWDDRMAEY